MLLALLLPAGAAWGNEEERSFTVINASQGLADNSAQVVMCTLTGRLIISTNGNLNFFDGKSFTHADARTEHEYKLDNYNGHYHLYFDHAHHIWLKDKHKVFCLDLMTERYVQNVDSVLRQMGCQKQVLDLFVDQKFNSWFLTTDGLYSPRYQWTYHVERDQHLQDVDVYGDNIYMFYDDGQVIAFDTLGTVTRRLSTYDAERSQRYNSSSVLLPWGDGFFQIRNGERGAIFLYFDAKAGTFTPIMEQDYHLNNMVFDPQQQHVYIPCEYGYWIYNIATGEMEHISKLHLTTSEMIETDCNAMSFDHQGGLWIGTEKRGVLYARPHSVTFRAYPWSSPVALRYAVMMDSLGQNISSYHGLRANCQYTDSRGWVWTGTRKGVYIERPGRRDPLAYTRRDGISNEVIHSIIEDRDHNIWASTSCGILFFLVRNGEIAFVNNFTGGDNVPEETFENGKAMLLPDGLVVMQAIEHVVVFNPEELREVNEPRLVANIKPKLVKLLVNGNQIEPNTAVDGNVILDRALSRVKHINLKSDQNSISLTFSGLNYFRPTQTYYRVRVWELGNQWQDFSAFKSGLVDSRGMLHYPMANLKPGNYHVEVQTSMFPGVWEDTPDDKRFIWEIHVKEPWWRTTGLFMLLGAVLLALLIVNFFYYNRNTRMRDRRNSEEGDIIRKIRFFVERTDVFASQPLAPLAEELSSGAAADASQKLTPEFIDLMLKMKPVVAQSQNRTLTMRLLSDACGVDIVTLYEVVSANLYKSPRDLARIIKLRRAAEMLTNTSDTIEQIATACGFYTPNYFMGNFFHEYKMTPQEYRNQHN